MRILRNNHHAFTLLELVLTLLVIAVIAAMVAPRLLGFANGRQLTVCAGDVESMARYARSQAIADSRVYRLNLDTSAQTFWLSLEDGPEGQTTSTPLDGSMGVIHPLPDKVTIRFTDPSGTAGTVVRFKANGRCDAGTIELTDSTGQTVKIDCPTETDGYRIVPKIGGM